MRAWALLVAVEWWLSRSRAAAVTGGAGRWSLRWPAGSLGYAAGTCTPGGAGFSTAPLIVPRPLHQASVQPSPPPAPAQRPTPGWHEARRSLPWGPSRTNRCRARRLGPGKHRHREAGVIPVPCRASRPGRPKQRDAFMRTLLTAAPMPPAKSLALGGVSRDQQAHDRP